MTYKSLKETEYLASGPKQVLLISPHGADPADFLAAFPEIAANPQLQAIWPLFETYLAIERDAGADELAHAIAHNLARRYDIPARVICFNYPRAIVDGGRLLEHSLRSCLPNQLLVQLKTAFLDLHQKTLRRVDELYQEIKQGAARFLIDVHTMASFCPIDKNGTRFIQPVAFPSLEDYVTQFLEARDHSYRRSLDLITADDHGQRFADPALLAAFERELRAEGYPLVENTPYCASSAYLSHQHLKSVPSISFDVPKHLLAAWADDFADYQLDEVPLSAEKIDRMARCMARAVQSVM